MEADARGRKIVPVMLTFYAWPPSGVAAPVRKILASYTPIDLSNGKIYDRNMKVLIERLKT